MVDRYVVDEYGQVLKDGVPLKDFIKELNDLEEKRKRKGKEIAELRKINALCFDVIDGYRSFEELRWKGMIE